MPYKSDSDVGFEETYQSDLSINEDIDGQFISCIY